MSEIPRRDPIPWMVTPEDWQTACAYLLAREEARMRLGDHHPRGWTGLSADALLLYGARGRGVGGTRPWGRADLDRCAGTLVRAPGVWRERMTPVYHLWEVLVVAEEVLVEPDSGAWAVSGPADLDGWFDGRLPYDVTRVAARGMIDEKLAAYEDGKVEGPW